MNTKEPTVFLQAFPDQDIFTNAVLSGLYKFLLFAGDIRSGKSIICLSLLVLLCKIYPKSRWVVIRRDIPTIKRNTLPTFFKYCCPPRFLVNFNQQELQATFYNGSQIFFMSENASEDTEGLRFLGLEVNGCLFEQIEECQRKTFNIMMSRTGQWKIDPMPPQLILANCNPTDNWVKEVFYDPFMAGMLNPPFYFQEADIKKNPYIGKDFLDTLFENWPKELIARFLQKRWESTDIAMQLNSWEDIYACKNSIEVKNKTKYMGVDVGHSGADPSVWMVIDDNIIEIHAIEKTTVPEVTRKTIDMALKYNLPPENICVDVVGIGAGVGDELDEAHFNVIKMRGGDACSEYLGDTNFQFSNIRSWSFWIAADALKKRQMGNFSNASLTSEAGAIKYGIKGDKQIYILPKEELKKVLKRSTDHWDVFTYAYWAKVYNEMIGQNQVPFLGTQIQSSFSRR